jgi:hypothetical protein
MRWALAGTRRPTACIGALAYKSGFVGQYLYETCRCKLHVRQRLFFFKKRTGQARWAGLTQQAGRMQASGRSRTRPRASRPVGFASFAGASMSNERQRACLSWAKQIGSKRDLTAAPGLQYVEATWLSRPMRLSVCRVTG